jgi:hypothetical protein
MFAAHLDHLADEARAVLACNPLLATSSAGLPARRNLLKRRARYAGTLSAIADVKVVAPQADAFARHFPELADGGYRHSERLSGHGKAGPVGLDPYRSSALATWMDGLERGLGWVASGANAQVLEYYLQPDLMEADFIAERQPVRRLACGIGLLRIETLAASRMMQPRVAQCLPDFPSAEYPTVSESDLDAIAEHLDAAVSLAFAVDPAGTQLLAANLHSLHVGLRHDPLCSFSSSNELPGSAIVILSKERLRAGDHAATAAQLLHEAGHVLLGLYTTSAAASLPCDFTYVSPYKNDLQTLESILHMAYTIPWECAVRMACLSLREDPERRAREAAFVIAYASRQLPLIDIARSGLDRLGGDVLSDLPDIAAIPFWNARVLALVDMLLESETPQRRQAHLAERQRVMERQAWDLGQMVLRGCEPIDPRLQSREIDETGASVSLWYDGTRHVIHKAEYRPTSKDYGRYAELIGRNASMAMEVA